jgi:hypothetical protein
MLSDTSNTSRILPPDSVCCTERVTGRAIAMTANTAASM